MYSTTSFRQLTPHPAPSPLLADQGLHRGEGPQPWAHSLGLALQGGHLVPKRSPQHEGTGGISSTAGEEPSSTRRASRLSRTAQTKLALVSCLENSWGWGGAERGTPRTEVIFRDKRGVALGWGSTKWAELSQ